MRRPIVTIGDNMGGAAREHPWLIGAGACTVAAVLMAFLLPGGVRQAQGEPGAREHAAAAATPAPTTTELHDYAALACTALLTWAVDARAGTPAGQPQGDGTGAERERLVAAYAYLAESTEQATSNIAELGTPDAAGGGAGAALLLAAVDESAGAYRAAQARAAELPDEGFAQARAALLASTDGAVRDAVAGLPRLSGDEGGSALDSAIADDPGCALAGEAVRDL